MADDEAPTLQQYSKQLNVYNADESERGRLLVNSDDYFEVSYKSGLGPVLLKNVWYQAEFGLPLHNLDQEIYNVNAAIQTESGRALIEEAVLSGQITAEVARAQTEEGKLAASISAEVTARESAVSSLNADLAQEVADRINGVTALNHILVNETSARRAADTVHSTSIAENALAISAEAKRADDEEKRIVGLISAETAARVAGDATVTAAVATEKARAETAEAGLQTAISSTYTSLEQKIAGEVLVLNVSLAAESQRAQLAEAHLGTRIDQVLSNIDQAAIDSFTEVVQALGNTGATSLSEAINNETTARETAVAAVQTQLDAIQAMLLALQAGY